MTCRACCTSRSVFEISPGQVCWLRVEPLTSRIRVGVAGSCWRACAAAIAALVRTHSTGSATVGSASPAPAGSVRGDLR
jgi:hypothetical protein